MKLRILIIVLLIAVGLAFIMSDGMYSDFFSEPRPVPKPSPEELRYVVDTLLARYNIPKNQMTTWRVQNKDKSFARVERRVLVPYDFISIEFNNELNKMAAEFGARAVATERSKDQVVTMHIIKDGLIHESIGFVLQPEPEKKMKKK